MMFTYVMQIRQLTLALKPRGYVTRNPKRGASGPKIAHVQVSNKKLFKEKQ